MNKNERHAQANLCCFVTLCLPQVCPKGNAPMSLQLTFFWMQRSMLLSDYLREQAEKYRKLAEATEDPTCCR
jgi:hypothetical protein